MDVNVVIELSERLFRELKKHPDLVEKLLMADICPRFIGFYERRTGRRHTRPSASRTSGSGWAGGETETGETDSPQGVS
jgi:hypothetical protein